MPKVIKKIKHPENTQLGKKQSMVEFSSACYQQWEQQAIEKK